MPDLDKKQHTVPFYLGSVFLCRFLGCIQCIPSAVMSISVLIAGTLPPIGLVLLFSVGPAHRLFSHQETGTN